MNNSTLFEIIFGNKVFLIFFDTGQDRHAQIGAAIRDQTESLRRPDGAARTGRCQTMPVHLSPVNGGKFGFQGGHGALGRK